MVTPAVLEKKRANDYDIKVLEEVIDKALLEDYKNHGVHKVVVNDDVPKEVAVKLAKSYVEHGWKYVYVGYEDVPGANKVTVFIFSMEAEPAYSDYEKVDNGFAS